LQDNILCNIGYIDQGQVLSEFTHWVKRHRKYYLELVLGEIGNQFSAVNWSPGVLGYWSNGTMEKKILFMITAWSFLIAAPAVHGARMHVADILAERIQSVRSFAINWKSIVVAENEQKAAENRSRSTSENQEQTAQPEAAARENSSNDSDGAAAKPLKPFRPSEEIAAEQAVDFPVDI
jgi:hypothetical protein